MKFVNPYNFVPLNSEEPMRGSSDRNLMEKDNYTGYISYELLTKTPLFIPNTSTDDAFGLFADREEGDDPNADPKKHKSLEFFSYEDLSKDEEILKEEYKKKKNERMNGAGPVSPVIPGSEIRGMLRSYYEILTNSCLSAVDSDSEVILGKRTNEVFKAGLLQKEKDGTFSLFKAEDCLVRTQATGSLVDKRYFDENNDWKIKSYRQSSIQEGQRISFKMEERGDHIKPLALLVDSERTQSKDIGYFLKGEDGPETGDKQEKHCGHVFKKDELICQAVDVRVLDRALAEYERASDSYKEYKERWEIFKRSGEVEACFPVYYSTLIGRNNDMVVYLSPGCITREIYRRTMSGLLGQYAPCDDKACLCPACSLFGTIGKEKDGKAFSVSSRLRFTDLVFSIGQGEETYDSVVTLKELSSPKISNTEFYLRRPVRNAWFWTYDYYIDDKGGVHLYDMEINGRKFYWHRDEADIPQGVKKTERNMTIRPLKAGKKFIGKLYFENISKKELDTLIFLLNSGEKLSDVSLNEKEHGFKLGAGKPLGLGSIAIAVTNINLRKVEKTNGTISINEVQYSEYDPNALSLDAKIVENFRKMTSFRAIKETDLIQYPQTDEAGAKGEYHIYDWFVGNHLAYQIDRRNGNAKVEIGMPNRRTQMFVSQYMEAMRPSLVSVAGIEGVKRKVGRRSNYRLVDNEKLQNIKEQSNTARIQEDAWWKGLPEKNFEFSAAVGRHGIANAAIAQESKGQKVFKNLDTGEDSVQTGGSDIRTATGKVKLFKSDRDHGYIEVKDLGKDIGFSKGNFAVRPKKVKTGKDIMVTFHEDENGKLVADSCEFIQRD